MRLNLPSLTSLSLLASCALHTEPEDAGELVSLQPTPEQSAAAGGLVEVDPQTVQEEPAPAPQPEVASVSQELSAVAKGGVDYELEELSDYAAEPAPKKMKSSARSVRSRRPHPSSSGGAPYASRPPARAPAVRISTPSTEDYRDYGVNERTLTTEDALSTFSVDVDTASYTITRRKLREGILPPAASVRVEEFVNYFPYEYQGPEGDIPFGLSLEAAPSPWDQDTHLLRVGLQTDQPDSDRREPLHLTFLVDTSGSMSSSDKLTLVKRSLRFLVDQLQPQDTVSLATYAGSVRRVLSPTPISERDAIHAAIEELSAGGSTAMSSGIDLAYEMAAESLQRGGESRVVVCSDGDANVGPASHDQILQQIRGYAKQGVTLSTLGFGMGNYKDTMMEQLANQGDGNYAYIDTFSEAKRVFGQDLAGTLQLVAKDVKIQVEFNPEVVSSYRLIGYENRDIADSDFRRDSVDAGEIGTGHQVTALYELVLDDARSSDSLAQVHIRAKRPGADSPAREWKGGILAGEVKGDFAESSDNLRLALAAASFAEKLRHSPYTSELGFGPISQLLEGMEQRSGVTELGELIYRAERLSEESALTQR